MPTPSLPLVTAKPWEKPMTINNPVSRRLAFMRIGSIALAASAFPLTISATSAWADKGGSSGGGGDGGGSSGGGGEGSDHGSSSNSGPGSANSGKDSSESNDDGQDVAETETEHQAGSVNTNPTPLASKRKRRGRIN